MESPIISVIMSVYNGEKYVAEAINSIINQTFKDFEFIIIDDGSTDNSLIIVKTLSLLDERIRIIENDGNIGLAKSLNRGISLARGKYIARMDADDISLHDRFMKQVDYLEKHHDIAVVGGSVIYINDEGKEGYHGHYPLSPYQVKWQLFFVNPMSHPSTMLRRKLFSEYGIHYNEQLTTTQDYDLWVQVSKQFQLANLPDQLLYYRQHGDSISYNSSAIQKKNNLLIRKELINNTLKMKFSNNVIEASRKPFSETKLITVLLSICLILLLKKRFQLSKLENLTKK